MPVAVDIFRAPSAIPGLFDSFLGGMYVVKGLPLAFQLALILAYGLCFLSAWYFSASPQRHGRRAVVFFAVIAFGLSSLLLFQPWDELFVNLRHSLHLRDSSFFSFNAHQAVEGTVDFLPYFLVGLLGKIGLPLIETNFLICLVAGWFCIEGARRVLLYLDVPGADLWTYPVALLYPPLLLNCSHGFSTPIFGAAVLWGIIYFLEQKPTRGLVLLALLPTIRLEGTLWSLLGFVYFVGLAKPKKAKAVPVKCLLVFLPVILLSLWRWQTFGSPIPLPIAYKSALGNFFFTLIGMRNLVADGVASYACLAVLVLGAIGLTRAKNLPPKEKALLQVLGLLGIFCFPYYLSGGDWFPAAWARYLFPFAFFSVILAAGLLVKQTLQAKSARLLLLTGVLAIPFAMIPFGSFQRVDEDLFLQRPLLARLIQKRQGRGNTRIQYLSRLGEHLKRTTPPDATLATSEMATIVYFADREGLDLLGIANPEIVREPLRPTPDLLRKSSPDHELPFLIFKRLQPDLVGKYRPGYLYTFDFFPSELLDGLPYEELTDEKIGLALKRWDVKFKDLNGILYGGIEKLLAQGYSPVVVGYSNHFYSMYFVSREAKAEHYRMLKAAGFHLSQSNS